MAYTKLDENIVTSSVWSEDDQTFRVWVYLLARAGADGRVKDTIPAIARACGYDIDRTHNILQRLAAPDPYSRTPDHDGRRIRIVDQPEFAIQVLNHGKYRAKAHTGAERTAAWRAKQGVTPRDETSPPVTDVTPRDVTVTQDRRQKTEANGNASTRHAREAEGPKANPLFKPGDRPRYELECLDLVSKVAELTDKDPVEVFREASSYDGARRAGSPNPANLSDDRLVNTLLDLRQMLKRAQEASNSRTLIPPDVERVVKNAAALVDEFLAWWDRSTPIGPALARWRDSRGISFEASAAAGLLRLACDKAGAA